jgi:hypothetical protein
MTDDYKYYVVAAMERLSEGRWNGDIDGEMLTELEAVLYCEREEAIVRLRSRLWRPDIQTLVDNAISVARRG